MTEISSGNGDIFHVGTGKKPRKVRTLKDIGDNGFSIKVSKAAYKIFQEQRRTIEALKAEVNRLDAIVLSNIHEPNSNNTLITDRLIEEIGELNKSVFAKDAVIDELISRLTKSGQ